jgi:hypothetical protein
MSEGKLLLTSLFRMVLKLTACSVLWTVDIEGLQPEGDRLTQDKELMEARGSCRQEML